MRFDSNLIRTYSRFVQLLSPKKYLVVAAPAPENEITSQLERNKECIDVLSAHREFGPSAYFLNYLVPYSGEQYHNTLVRMRFCSNRFFRFDLKQPKSTPPPSPSPLPVP